MFSVFGGFHFHGVVRKDRVATPFLLQPLKRRRLRRPSPHRPRRRTISPEAYRADLPTIGRRRAFTGYGSGPFSPHGDMNHPEWATVGNPYDRRRDEPSGARQRFTEGRCLASHRGRNAVLRSLPTWPLRHESFSGPPGGLALAAYPPNSSGGSSREFRTGTDPHG